MSVHPIAVRTEASRGRLRPRRWLRSVHHSELRLLILTLGWLLATVAGFIWGPLKYDIANRQQLYIFLLAVHVAYLIGFLRGTRSRLRPYSFHLPPARLVRWCVVISLCYVVVTIPLSPTDAVDAIRSAMRDPLFARDVFIRSLGGWRDYLGIIVAPFTMAVVPLGIFYWRFIGWGARCGVLLLGATTIFRSIAAASRHGIWAAIVVVAGALFAAHVARTLRVSRLALAVISGAVLIGFVVYSNFIATERVPEGVSEEYAWALNADWVDVDHVVFTAAPPKFRQGLLQGFAYFTHGYRGLAEALEQPFRGVLFGVGNSMFLSRNAARLFTPEAIDRISLPHRLVTERGFAEAWWMTAYPWFASDVTFPGTVLLVMVIAYGLAASFRDAVFLRNPFAVVTFTWFLYMVVSFPQGSVTQDGSAVVAIAASIILWRLSRRHVRRSVRTIRTQTVNVLPR